MAKKNKRYTCQSCGTIQTRWSGQCPDCENWNTLLEEIAPIEIPKSLKQGKGQLLDFASLEGKPSTSERLLTQINEFDRVCGGGLVPGSVVLIGGDPGIGKSTLLLQVASKLGTQTPTAYVSGEEAIDQVRLRAQRLSVEKTPVQLAASTHLRDIITTLDRPDGPKVAIIDSIQTMFIDNIDAAPGTVSQVRACTQELIRVAKSRGIIILLVGHVTKEGTLAGPRVLEHMVDTVFYFEGDRGHHFRILRSVKNRFGATDEIGVFEMNQKGLEEVLNPSALFLAERQENVSGSVVFAGLEGTRPMLVEIQALVAKSNFATPRRTVIGWDTGRLAMITAVLDTRCHLSLSSCDIYLNVAGGLKIIEPAADLAVAAALVSALSQRPLPHNTVIFGEVGLSGEVRRVPGIDSRLKEAEKLGFKEVWMPKTQKSLAPLHIKRHSFSYLKEILPYLIQEESGNQYGAA